MFRSEVASGLFSGGELFLVRSEGEWSRVRFSCG